MSKKHNMDFVDLESLECFEFGKYLRSVRQAKGISIRQLAKEVDKTPTYLSDIEKLFLYCLSGELKILSFCFEE